MSSLKLSYILERAGLNLRTTKMIRHASRDKHYKACCEAGFFEIYQSTQKVGFFDDVTHILSFVSSSGTSAKFLGCYKTGDIVTNSRDIMPKGYPFPENEFSGNGHFCYLKKLELLSDLDSRMIINWGSSARAWNQWAYNDKDVLSIQENAKYTFSGYDTIILPFADLCDIINDPILYENWHTALSAVNAVYLITDTTDGKQYIGSTYGTNGLLGRWRCYAETKTGNNKDLNTLIHDYPTRHLDFQFSILQVLPKNITPDDAIKIENIYKSKLLTRPFGLNAN